MVVAIDDKKGGTLRRVIDLSGTWQVAEGSMEQVPTTFDHTAPVPGLADMAKPAFDEVGGFVSLKDRRLREKGEQDPRREAFWYRRTFAIDDSVPAVALLKVNKARYGTKVLLNGHPVGEHMPCFTPGYFDLKSRLRGKGQKNELVIRIGASLSALPDSVIDGWDYEAMRYIPGIYDRVELILTDTPHVVNVQAVPDVRGKAVRAVVQVAHAGGQPRKINLLCRVREAESGKQTAEKVSESRSIAPGQTEKFDVTIPIHDCRLWSPENPFLYRLEVTTGTDSYTTRFGVRSFETEPESGRVLLNGKPYYMRGSNVCILRFFEDAEHGGKPWNEAWVRKLHRRFKDMHWNSLRYCIGFPPELWYEIADKEGFLIQDEFPIWYGRQAWSEAIRLDDVVTEYTEWMRERWNHPCVVIWDAQNETADDSVTRPAIAAVRDLDLSKRPWDNGWGTPQAAHDVTEWHPYLANQVPESAFSLSVLEDHDGMPRNGPREGAHPPYIINEYGWLWINRDGSLPTLTQKVYENTLGPNATVNQRRHYYARTVAALTEFWRCKRKCAGVLHFCGLSYSRPNGHTSDNFGDIDQLEYEPYFYQYVRDAFSPVGVMIDFWREHVSVSTGKLEVPVTVINDMAQSWQGELTLKLLHGRETVWRSKQATVLKPYGKQESTVTVPLPSRASAFTLVAELDNVDGEIVRSLRDLNLR